MTTKFLEHKTVDNTKKGKQVAGVIKDEMVDPIRKFIKERNQLQLKKSLQKEYMKGSFYLGGGKTGMARRLSWDEPSLTLTCAPAMKQTERCHPSQTRPLSLREYARIQTFPDTWEFEGSITSVYRQIGNAVPVILSYKIATSVLESLQKVKC